MERRKFLTGISGVAVGGSALLGSGAFSRVESQRSVSIAVAEDPDAYLGLKPLDTPNSQNYVALDDVGHLYIQIDGEGDQQEVGGDGPIGEGVNSDSRTWFDGMFQICNQGKEDACVSWEFSDDFEMRDEAELYFYYDGDEDDDPSTEGRVDIEEGREVPLELGECARIGLRTETFDVDATDDDPLFTGEISLVADVDGDCFVEDPTDPQVVSWTEVGDTDEAGGPVVLMGLDSELGAGSSSHGTPEEHSDMVEALMDNVTKDHDDRLLVIGISGSGSQSYWEDDIVANVDSLDSVTFVNGAENIEDEDFEEYAMIGVGSSDNQISGGLTDDENVALDERSDDIADFVNQGGALLGKTQNGLNRAWNYVDPFGDFEAESTSFSSIQITQAGLDLGLTQDGMDGWCCYHEVILNFPDFFDVLLDHDDGGTYEDEAAAIGGEDVIVEREVALSITGLNGIQVGETESYNVELENRGEEKIEGEFVFNVVAGNATVDNDLPDTIELDSGESFSQDDAIEVTCNDAGATEIDVELVDIDDGSRLVEVTMDPQCL